MLKNYTKTKMVIFQRNRSKRTINEFKVNGF